MNRNAKKSNPVLVPDGLFLPSLLLLLLRPDFDLPLGVLCYCSRGEVTTPAEKFTSSGKQQAPKGKQSTKRKGVSALLCMCALAGGISILIPICYNWSDGVGAARSALL